MLGAIIGDIVGSPYEDFSDKIVDFELFIPYCKPTDDSIMTIALGCACVNSDLSDESDFKLKVAEYMRELGNKYPYAGYGGKFYRWLKTPDMGPYGSFGNGSAMRVSPVAWAANTLEQAETLAMWSAEVTHDHPEGIRGAQAVAAAVWMARTGADKDEIKAYINEKYYKLDFTLDEIREDYRFDVTCQGSVPQALECFFEAESYEDAIRLAVSLGGDCDTQAAMAGAVAEAFFGIPDDLAEEGLSFLDDTLSGYYFEYSEQLYGN
ncbi:MAG: ADP-ribosylglycohydrolase family protein [Clostridia bacterium]|nr:ADP-ribosylglycohydrolase family protein [Clostridia bacterium]